MIGLVAFLLLGSGEPVQTVGPEEFHLAPEQKEYCRKSDGSEVDLRTVALLKNEKLDLRPYGVGAIVTVDRDWIDVSASRDRSVRSYRQDVGYGAVPGESLDVDLSLALYQGRPFLHWKETFKHRAARLGLLSFKADGHLEPFCVGGPTVTVAH
jgi:hypothetical protein